MNVIMIINGNGDVDDVGVDVDDEIVIVDRHSV